MVLTIENFDISSVTLEERYLSPEYNTMTFYFIAPVEWLGGRYPDAIRAEISVECPPDLFEAQAATVMISPTKEDEDGNMEDYDWSNLDLSYEDIEKLIELGQNTHHGCVSCPVRPYDATYRGSICAALRANVGVDFDPADSKSHSHAKKEFCINIKETLEMQVCVEADSLEEAFALVEKNYKDGEYVLDGDHFTDVEFTEVTA